MTRVSDQLHTTSFCSPPVLSNTRDTRGTQNTHRFCSYSSVNHNLEMYLSQCVFLFNNASCITIALLEISSVIRPPMILQWDDGNEINAAVMTRKQAGEYRGKSVQLTVIVLKEIITEVKRLWPECWMVRRSPHHSPFNGGVE